MGGGRVNQFILGFHIELRHLFNSSSIFVIYGSASGSDDPSLPDIHFPFSHANRYDHPLPCFTYPLSWHFHFPLGPLQTEAEA